MARGVSRLDEARQQGRLWTPNLSDVDFWWSGADGQADMTTWPARQGGVDLAQTGSSTGTPGRYGAVPARMINGLNGYYSGAVPLSGLSGATIFIFGSINDRGGTNNSNGVLSYSQGDATYNNDILWGVYSSTAMLLQFNNGVDGGVSDNGVLAYSGALFARFDGSDQTIQMIVNGIQRGTLGSFIPPTTLSTGMNTLVLGRYAARLTSSAWAGNATIAHLLIWRRALTTAEMNRVSAWAAWEAGVHNTTLSADNPYLNRPPLIGD